MNKNRSCFFVHVRLLKKVVQKYNKLLTYTNVNAKRTKKDHKYIAKK
jgi:hypothetical protein